jgi:hypothetical protein
MRPSAAAGEAEPGLNYGGVRPAPYSWL